MHDSESDDDRDDDEMIYTTWPGSRSNPQKSSSNLRARVFGGAFASSRARDRAKTICTTPGQLCAGETETEIDEPVSWISRSGHRLSAAYSFNHNLMTTRDTDNLTC